MPMIEVSEEEYQERLQDEVLAGIVEARRTGDEEALNRLWKEWAPSARILMMAKRCLGAEWIRERGIDTSAAEQEYGSGWLDA